VKERLLRSLPTVLAGVALAAASREPVPPMIVVAFALASVLLAARLPLDRATQRLALVVIVVLTVVGIRASGMPVHGPHLGAFGYGFALAPLVMTGLRLWIRPVEGTSRVDISLCLLSLLATGGARPGLVYLAFVVALLGSAVALRRSADRDRLAFGALSPLARRVAGALLVTAAAAGLAAAGGARLAYGALHRRLLHASEAAYEETPGLSDSVRLGKLTSLLGSDDVVLRVSGPEVDRLRGPVLDEYGGGRWTMAKTETLVSVDVARTRPSGRDVVDVRHVHPDRDYVFLPLGVRDVGTAQGEVRADSMGVAHSLPGDGSPDVWFHLGERDSLRVAAPRITDLLMPVRLRKPLTAIANEWTRGTSTPEEALAALGARLRRDYTYSLVHEPRTSLDPILEFLTVSREGHCEYFASALALLARTLGIPTRMVLGYRVGERNPYWAHRVVRKKNAHAWVEAYLPDGTWLTVDPTPMTELAQDMPHDERGLAAVLEGLAVVWERVEAWLEARSVFELGGAALLGVVVFAVQRWLRTRTAVAATPEDGLGFDPPLEAYARLEAELARRGRGREPSEPVERWVERLGDPGLAPVLLRYVAARYGDGEREGLEAALGAATRGIARGSR
jgi:protein-glutamine gamma-glutamyltransferase